MRRSMTWLAVSLSLGFSMGFLGLLEANAASPLESLVGYWQGVGKIAMTSGKTERVKCAVSYRAGEANSVKQTLRCSSPDYTINALAEIKVNGAAVTGSWEERTYSTTGEITGRQAGHMLTLNIKGASFAAALNVSTINCKQTINIAPQGTEVSRISIDLTKC